MSITNLERFLPEGTLPFLKTWFGEHIIHIKITRKRQSKLGDYRKMPDGSHQISVNGTLQPELFFFVLTHELAHLLAFQEFGYRISPHGQEWKQTFRMMLVDSISVYANDLKPIILKFAKAPKANFMSSPDLVKYFHIEDCEDESLYIEDLADGDLFIYRNERYSLDGKRKKNYLCTNLENTKKYIFRPLARVEKIS